MPQNPPQSILDLIARFENNVESYRSAAYNETQLRREFIDPFFEALGWDVANKAGHAEAYKDVIHEDAIKVGVSTKAPDYCFRIGGARKFFLEAKKPAINIKDDPEPAYQLRRYAWSAKLPLSILTDFEEFAVYDSRARPQPNAKPATGRIHYWTYKDYAARWHEIAGIFSKEAVLKGSFDKFAVSDRRRGTATVDAAFLEEIEGWRDALARNLALRNPDLSVYDLNFAVQRTIDRVIFLRICEDRGVETYGELRALHNGENVYDRLRYLYKIADDRYNSGLFHFQPEKGRAEAPDTLTPALRIDDKVLKDIIGSLYYPESPYEFSVFPIEILGQVYEQFLGKVIRLTPARHAKVEDKPEVKKAGGVYYTPAYIVDYIVKHTVGKLCEGKTPKQIAKLRILDPACGSGSFLIGAYTYLLDHHRDWYVKEGIAKHTKEVYQGAGGQWYLTTPEKKRILLNNIYGVDIDSQAVEVTKLSLLLKVLEGESQETISRQLKMWRERALPDLGNNIKCGNSLIGPDYFAGELLPDEEAMRRINPFDWKTEFTEIMKAGGFDAVIGNPPYIRIQTLKEWAPLEVEAYKDLFEAASSGNYDIYAVFVEKGLGLLNRAGRLGFILPHKFFQAQYGEPLRRLLANGRHVSEVVHFGDQQVFGGATTYTCLLFLDKAGAAEARIKRVANLDVWKSLQELNQYPAFDRDLPSRTMEVGKIPAEALTEAEWYFSVGQGAPLFAKLSKMPVVLGDIATRIYQGPITSADTVFLFKEFRPGKKRNTTEVFSQELDKWVSFESGLLKRVIRSGDIERYWAESTALVLFPYEVKECSARLLSSAEMRRDYPLAWEYLSHSKKLLENRESGSFKDAEWYRFGRTQNLGLWEQPKLMVPYMITELAAYFDQADHYYFINVTTGGYGITSDGRSGSLPYLCGLLNSRLLDFYLKRVSTNFQGGYFAANKQYIEHLPIRPIDFSNATDKTKHDRVGVLVERIVDLKNKLAGTTTPVDQPQFRRQIDETNREINRLVYDLYDLTPEEIAIVEGAGVASDAAPRENTSDEPKAQPANQSRKAERQSPGVAEAAQYAGESGGGPSGNIAGAGRPVDGVRERSGEYGPPQDPPEDQEERIGSTRLLETAEGPLPYRLVSERLAVALAGILEDIVHIPPDQIVVTPEWLCLRHQALAGVLFPAWAGRYRDVNVQVGAHTPPPFYEVPGLVRSFFDDLVERLRHVRGTESDALRVAELLAWTDWRLQWIHPFKDFNGRIGRVLLATVLYTLALPHVETAPLEREARRRYLDALHAADGGDLGPLTDVWLHRLATSLS